MVHTKSLWLLSFLRYIDIIIKIHEKMDPRKFNKSFRTKVRERLNNKNKNKEISRSGLVFQVEYLRNGKRYLSSVFSKNGEQESGYQTVQTSSL